MVIELQILHGDLSSAKTHVGLKLILAVNGLEPDAEILQPEISLHVFLAVTCGRSVQKGARTELYAQRVGRRRAACRGQHGGHAQRLKQSHNQHL